jgi:periplasmic protein TonB
MLPSKLALGASLALHGAAVAVLTFATTAGLGDDRLRPARITVDVRPARAVPAPPTIELPPTLAEPEDTFAADALVTVEIDPTDGEPPDVDATAPTAGGARAAATEQLGHDDRRGIPSHELLQPWRLVPPRPSMAEATPALPSTPPSTPPSPPPAAVVLSAVPGQQQTPDYPAIARRFRWQGTVVVAFECDRAGAVVAARVVQSSGHACLDAAALDAMRRWRFTNGPGSAEQPFEFRLAHDRTGT